MSTTPLRAQRALTRFLFGVVTVAPLLYCAEGSPTQPSGAIELQLVITSPSLPATAPVGTTVPPVSVQVLNKKNGQILYNEPVSFVVTAGGGTVYVPTMETDNMTGIAQDLWTLGTRAGFDTLQARVVDTSRVGPLSGSASVATFVIQAVPLAASAMSAQAGNGQTAVAGSAIAIAPAVLVTDRFGNPIAGVSVTFTVGAGGGSITGPSTTTNASGIATVGSWSLGSTAGPNTLTAASTGLSGSPVTFAATGINAASAQLIPAVPSTAFSGAVAGTIPASTGPAVRVVDKNNNGVPNVAVTFSVTGPTCPSCTPFSGTSPSALAKIAGVPSVTVLTDATGRASGGDWTLATLAGIGADTLKATAVGLSGSPVVFTATGTAGAAALLFKKAGDGQSASVGAAVPVAVQVTDAYGNPASSGIAVTFTVRSGGGSFGGASSATVATDLSGTATASWTLGSVAATNTLSATALGKSLGFTAIATGPAGLNITDYAGDAQAQAAGTALSIAPAAQVTDQSGHPVAGVQVTFSVTAGGGTVSGPLQLTNANGVATVGGWTLGPVAGTNELQAMFNTGVSSGYTIFVATGSLAMAWQQSLSGVGDVWSLAASGSGSIFAASSVFGGFPPETPIGIFRSTDNGASWTVPNAFSSSGATAVAINRSNGDVIAGVSGGGGPTGIPGPFGGGGSGLYRSADNGSTWVYWTVGNAGVFSVATKFGGLVLAASSNGVYTSPDNGTSWLFVGCCYPRSFAVTSSGTIFAGDIKFPTGGGPPSVGGVFRTTDQGATWTEVGLPNTAIYSLVATAGDHLFAGTASTGIFRSVDGVTWTQVNGTVTNPVTSLAVNSAGTVFAGVFGGGVLGSTDDGATWTQLNTGLANLAVESLTISSDGHLLAGTHGAVFRTVGSTTSP